MAVGVVTDATTIHSQFALLTATVCTATMTLIMAVAQSVTRLMAGGSLPSKQSSPEDKANFGAADGAAEDGKLPPYYEHVATIQRRENRIKLATRMHNAANNCYETPPICLLVFWGAFLASYNREYQEKIAQLSICFVVLRFFYIFFMLSGLNLKFLPLRSLMWISSLGVTFAAGGLGIAGAQEALKTTELAVACVDGVGCVCKTAGCIVGVIVGACVGFVFLVMLMSYVILSSTDMPKLPPLPYDEGPFASQSREIAPPALVSGYSPRSYSPRHYDPQPRYMAHPAPLLRVPSSGMGRASPFYDHPATWNNA